jgi:hypothetical protein
VAEENAKLIEEDNLDWYVLVEIGKPLCTPLIGITLSANGIGEMDTNQSFPVRLVRPTADELAAYPRPERTVAHG